MAYPQPKSPNSSPLPLPSCTIHNGQPAVPQSDVPRNTTAACPSVVICTLSRNSLFNASQPSILAPRHAFPLATWDNAASTVLSSGAESPASDSGFPDLPLFRSFSMVGHCAFAIIVWARAADEVIAIAAIAIQLYFFMRSLN